MSFNFASLQQLHCSCTQPLQFVRKLAGATQSLLVRDELGELWVLKLRNEAKLTNHLANEVLGAHLCNVLHIPAPQTKAVHISSFFFEDRGTWLSTLQSPIRLTAGLHFATRYLPQVTGRNMLNTIPGTLVPCISNSNECLGMFIFDVWARHRDARQVLYDECNAGLMATFIDNGELFGGAHWGDLAGYVDTTSAHRAVLFVLNRAELAQRWISQMRLCLPAALTFAIKQLPSNWLCSDPEALVDKFLSRLDGLPDEVAVAIDALEKQVVLTSTSCEYESRRRMVTTLDPDGGTQYYYMD